MAENKVPDSGTEERHIGDSTVGRKSVSKRVKRLEKAMIMYTESLFDNHSFSNVLARSHQPFYVKDKKTFKTKASEVATNIKTEVSDGIKEMIEGTKIKEQLIELDNMPVKSSTEGWQPTGEPEIDIKAFQYATKVKYLSENEENVEKEYGQLQKEYAEQLALYQSNKEQLKKLSERKRLQIEEYDENILKMETIIPAEIVLNNC